MIELEYCKYTANRAVRVIKRMGEQTGENGRMDWLKLRKPENKVDLISWECYNNSCTLEMRQHKLKENLKRKC